MTDRSESRQAGGQSGATGGAGPDTNGQITGQTIGQIIGRNLLLIEDEANIAEAIRFILSRDGWDVRLHADGADAMAKLRALRPDVVILDLMLPGRSGLEILAEMRADPDLARTPVLMLTARGQERDREAAARAGATRFLAKPFANSDLVACLRDMAAGASEGVGASEDGAVQSTAVENRFVKDAS
jgi:DNA-binding response OmpR family regulator